MPSVKTEGSELSLAFGILGIENPSNLDSQQLDFLFNNTLPYEKYNRYRIEFINKEQALFYKMVKVGKKLR